MRPEWKKWKKRIGKITLITLASALYGAGISLFLDPNNLAPGGVTGISIVLNRLSGLETGTLVFLINVPLILLGFWKFGWRFILSTFYAVVASSAFINVLQPYGPLTRQPMLAALMGSALVAVGLGTVFRAGATTGGTDIVIKMLRVRYPHLRTGVLFFWTDVMVVAWSGMVFQNVDTVLYAMVAVVVTSRLLDMVLYGMDEAKLFYIISDKPEEIAVRILDEIDIGVTYLQGEGGYSNQDKRVIMCVTKKQQAPKIEEVVKEEDPRAFTIITSATEIYGEGYKNIFAEKI